MPDAYELHDARFIQFLSVGSAANAVTLAIGAVVPEGKVWTILNALYFPDATETRTVSFGITAKGNFFPVRVPVSIALGTLIPYPLLTEGMEFKLYPGEILTIKRDAATAGSTMNSVVRYIETDLPYYSYVEPQGRVVAQKLRHGSVYRSTGSVSGGGVGGGFVPPGGGGGGEPQPV